MLIERSNLSKNSLSGINVLLTGAGGGIGYEAARALVWLGANVIIAEIDRDKGKSAETGINSEVHGGSAYFYEVDISDDEQVHRMCDSLKTKYGHIDVIFNNATVAYMGAVDAVDIARWDKSYAVNLRAPVLLAQIFLPEMKQRGSGTIILVPSSGAAPYMGAYEVFKTSQVELANTLAGELEETGINVFSIGPGLVKTDTAAQAIETVSSLMGMSLDEFYALNESHLLDAEAAGTGFAVAVAFAEKYNCQEIGSIQALLDAGVYKGEAEQTPGEISDQDRVFIRTKLTSINATYLEQYEGWLKRNLFERQWVMRDFKKTTGHSIEQFRDLLGAAQPQPDIRPLLEKLHAYYAHQLKLLAGYEKNPDRLKENSAVINGWMDEISEVIRLLP